MSKQLKIDQEELESLEQDQKQFLNKAIIGYLKCLRGTDAHDLWVFRLISLWFQNQTDEETNNVIQNKIKELESYKFLPLMYQLAARMGSQASSVFTNTLTNLIMNIAIDHPHHALPVILALSNADKDPVDGLTDSNHPSSSQQSDISSVKDRMTAAKKMISYLYKSKIGSLTKSYANLCDAYISLAYLPVEKKARKSTIPSDQPLVKFRNLQNIPIISEDVKIDRTCEYKNIIGIHSFGSEFRLCGGLTLPKVIKCLGTDGIEREQLVKGRDDLRQDAVMQQVFCLVNNLLERETETKKRRLHIRTYKVVPVSRRSGVLQWCEGTQVLSQYLVGPPPDKSAHSRYYPNMYSHIDCRKKMETIASTSVLQKKREIFDSICANYPPVFRYFFLEHFPEPSAWFERRLCYTKSVAASSIVGYILGLGDRHVNNILIDRNTAEVVHIDFGIAFEKGRVLATPETVPFRLTRDIVDGMGISAIEGTFKRCSEKTLEVLRKSQDVLLTILDVLLHDPLYEWTVPSSKSPSAASSKVQSHEVNKLAERALMRLQQKLQGLEEGVAMSIEGQVNLLIQTARDPNNLCRLYAGWQPYL